MAVVFSDGLDQALVVMIVKNFESRGKGYLGRTAIQKLCYFAQEMGAPISYSFQIYHYGPYSDQLASAVDFMLAERVISDQSFDPAKYSSYCLGPNANELLEKYDSGLRKWNDLIESIVSVLGGLQPDELELVATLRFVFQRLRIAEEREPSKTKVIDEFTSYKGSKFDRKVVDTVYDLMMKVGLLS